LHSLAPSFFARAELAIRVIHSLKTRVDQGEQEYRARISGLTWADAAGGDFAANSGLRDPRTGT
jgi:hypothetical protein